MQSCWYLDLGLSASRSMRNESLLLISHLICGSLLQQLERTKTLSNVLTLPDAMERVCAHSTLERLGEGHLSSASCQRSTLADGSCSIPALAFIQGDACSRGRPHFQQPSFPSTCHTLFHGHLLDISIVYNCSTLKSLGAQDLTSPACWGGCTQSHLVGSQYTSMPLGLPSTHFLAWSPHSNIATTILLRALLNVFYVNFSKKYNLQTTQDSSTYVFTHRDAYLGLSQL